MTTISRRSFSGPEFAQFASTLLVCAGLLLLPEPVSSDRDASSGAGTSVCAGSSDASGNRQWTDEAGLNPPDSCDDEDDEDDGDDDSPGGSGKAIAASQHASAHHDDTLHVVHVDVVTHTFRPLDAHSLRGPPSVHPESSDADVDDDDDDSVGAHHSVPLAAANSRRPHLLTSVDSFHAASIRYGQALRAPPSIAPSKPAS